MNSINSANLPCPSCKTPNQMNARFCLNCGSALNAQPQETPYEPPATQKTAPPMAGEFLYAGFWKRFFAYILDAIIYGFIIFVLLIFVFGMNVTIPENLEFALMINALYYLGWWMYFSLCESSSAQATFGKRMLGIKVTDLNGHGLSFGHAAGRQLSGVISSFTFTIGYLMAAFSRRKQALHDMVAGTVVVNSNFGPNQITLVNDSPPPGMSIGAIFGVVVLVLAIPVGGIIAAVAIPAYHMYNVKAQVVDAYQHASTTKEAIVEYAVETGYWPANFEQAKISSSKMKGEYYFIQLEANGVLSITFNNPEPVTGNQLILTPDITTGGKYEWECESENMSQLYLPSDCQ
ncbi:RDD family protein [Aliikangiella coralliicola]|uniref:RDD domain-containing protein n=1 Tax=Aliikangiella coralliicola TaxID=2592383 RepID=A0A545U7Z3_9GAMM|nr:RDD family protein [Aliikangiella coralliicola]TQV85587.1 hypothetical protein FLL46_20755 [Aliikangiella coralliicola]